MSEYTVPFTEVLPPHLTSPREYLRSILELKPEARAIRTREGEFWVAVEAVLNEKPACDHCEKCGATLPRHEATYRLQVDKIKNTWITICNRCYEAERTAQASPTVADKLAAMDAGVTHGEQVGPTPAGPPMLFQIEGMYIVASSYNEAVDKWLALPEETPPGMIPPRQVRLVAIAGELIL